MVGGENCERIRSRVGGSGSVLGRSRSMGEDQGTWVEDQEHSGRTGSMMRGLGA
jgi:hypothetical protein